LDLGHRKSRAGTSDFAARDRIQRTPDGIQRTPDGIQRTPDGIQRTVDGVRRPMDAMQRTPNVLILEVPFCVPGCPLLRSLLRS